MQELFGLLSGWRRQGGHPRGGLRLHGRDLPEMSDGQCLHEQRMPGDLRPDDLPERLLRERAMRDAAEQLDLRHRRHVLSGLWRDLVRERSVLDRSCTATICPQGCCSAQGMCLNYGQQSNAACGRAASSWPAVLGGLLSERRLRELRSGDLPSAGVLLRERATSGVRTAEQHGLRDRGQPLSSLRERLLSERRL